MKMNRIFWRIGQEITPETFIEAENYHCSQNSLIRKLIAGKYYGLPPQGETDAPPLTVQARLNRTEVCIDRLACYGVTRAGHLIAFDDSQLASLPGKQLPLPASNARALYVVLRVNPFEPVLIEPVDREEAPEAHPYYELSIKELDKIEADELAILKIDSRNHSPEIDSEYIPPCMSVNACSTLCEVTESVKKLFAEIRSVVEQKKDRFGKLMYPLTLLHYELDEFELSEPPIALIRLIKKIILTCRFFIPDIRNIAAPDSTGEYNHNDVAIIFKSLLSCLREIKQRVGKVETVIEEDFTPKI